MAAYVLLASLPQPWKAFGVEANFFPSSSTRSTIFYASKIKFWYAHMDPILMDIDGRCEARRGSVSCSWDEELEFITRHGSPVGLPRRSD